MDYHSILGIPINSSPDEIKKAFRKKAKELHPDKNPSPDAHQKFLLIVEAYEILTNKKLKPRPVFTYSPAAEKEQIRKTKYDRIKREEELKFKKELDDFRKESELFQNYFSIKRPAFILIGILIICSFYLYDRLEFIKNGQTTSGTAFRYMNTEGRFTGFQRYPVIEYRVENKIYRFESPINLDLPDKTTLSVIYRRADPQDSAIYSFMGFWFEHMTYLIVPLLLWFAFSSSFIKTGDLLQVNMRPLKVRIAKKELLKYA